MVQKGTKRNERTKRTGRKKLVTPVECIIPNESAPLCPKGSDVVFLKRIVPSLTLSISVCLSLCLCMHVRERKNMCIQGVSVTLLRSDISVTFNDSRKCRRNKNCSIRRDTLCCETYFFSRGYIFRDLDVSLIVLNGTLYFFYVPSIRCFISCTKVSRYMETLDLRDTV